MNIKCKERNSAKSYIIEIQIFIKNKRDYNVINVLDPGRLSNQTPSLDT